MPRAGLSAERVTRAAADLADAVGFDKITVTALARSFGVADASLYSHVKNGSDLRVRVSLHAVQEMADRVTDAVAGRSGRDSLRAFADAYRSFALEHPGRYAATQIQLDPQVAADSVGHLRVGRTTYAMLRSYGLDEPDLTDAVRLVRSTFHGFVTLEVSGGFGHPRDVAASWERVVNALDHLLMNWPS